MNASLERVVVTGSSGFVGRALTGHLDCAVTALHLSQPDWREQLGSADFEGATIFHLAARAHGAASDGSCEFDNAVKTRELAAAAARGRARRLVFASTVKVHGEETSGVAFRASDPIAPGDEYARSKWNAELALAEIARDTGLEVAVVRPPLVYGPGVRANLLALMRLADSGWPLPFGAIRNRRSFVQVDDLARLLIRCAFAAEAAGGAFIAAHAEAFSTPQLVAAIRRCLGRPARMFRMPPRAIEALAALGGARDSARRLTRSLEADPSETTRVLGWEAQIGFDTAVEDMVRFHREAEA